MSIDIQRSIMVIMPSNSIEPTTHTLAVPEKIGGRTALILDFFDRGANPCSLYPPPAALASVAVNSRHAAVNTEQQHRSDRRN